MAEYATPAPGPTRVAAIDFGTGFCSLAYTIANLKDAAPDTIANVRLSFNANSERVPTAILLLKNPDESNLKVAKFGSGALDEIIKMSSEDLEKHIYFECFKMNLFHEAEVGRNMQIASLCGKSYYLVEVIAFVLSYLKAKFVGHLSRCGASADDFHWVITVPAIWKASGKQLMREAAYMAGLLSKSNAKGISRLTPCDDESSMKVPDEINPHKLTLALEPECAALYCQQLTNDLIAPYSRMPDSLSAADSYMVCDLGAGTVDVTAHVKHGEDDIEVVIPPMGNDSGGKEINQQFYHLLEQIVGDTDFQSFLSSDKKEKKRIDRQVIITDIVFNEFEKMKQQFGMDDSDQSNDSALLTIGLPEKFVRFYTKEKIIEGIKDHRIVFVKSMCTLKIGYTKVNELFEPVVHRAIECIKKALMREEIKGRIKMIYLVGGFGGCQYTYSALKKAIPSDIQVVVPAQYTLAVSLGAVKYCRNPVIIKARRMDASYGIGDCQVFDDKIHDETYAYLDPDDGTKRCRDLFDAFVKKGQKVEITDSFKRTLIPYSQANVKETLNFYTTTDLSIKYTVDKHGKKNLEKIGSLTLDCPNPNNLEKKDREMEVTMDFSSTEIKVQARALYLPGQPPVKVILDFL